MITILFLPIFIISFIFSLLVAFYVPGIVITKTDKISGLAKHVIALVVGMVLWGWQGYLFGYAGIRWASYIYLLIFTGFYVYKRKTLFPKWQKITLQKTDVFIGLIITVGVIAQTIYYWKFGFYSSEGLSHTAFNIHDHYWHASMIREMIDRFPPYEPGMVGILKTNYHYWFNLVTAELIRVFYLPPLVTQGLGMYTYGSLLLGLLLYILGRTLHPSKMLVGWLLFFFYFASDISSWIVLYTQKMWDFRVPSLIEDGSNFMDNPPRAFSVIVGIAALYLFFKYLDNKYKNIFVLSILFGTLVGFKVYTAIGLLAGLGMIGLYHLVLKRRVDTLIIFIISVVLSAIIFFPVNGNSGGIFFLPFEKVRDFITYKPLGFFDMELRWRIFQEYHNVPRIIHLGILMSIVYFVIQFGTKLIGFVPYKKTFILLGREKILFCLTIIFISIVTGSFISLKANPAESYNFYLPGVLILCLISSLTLTLFLDKKPLPFVICFSLLLITFSMPRWFYRIVTLAPHAITDFSGISYSELASYDFLKKNVPRDKTVLVLNKGEKDFLSASVKVYSGRNMFLSGQTISNAHNTTDKNRIKEVSVIYESKNPQEVSTILKKNNISYLYFYNKPNLRVSVSQINGKVIFTNTFATVVEVK